MSAQGISVQDIFVETRALPPHAHTDVYQTFESTQPDEPLPQAPKNSTPEQLEQIAYVITTLDVFKAIFDAAARRIARRPVTKAKWDRSEYPPVCWMVPKTVVAPRQPIDEETLRGMSKYMLCDLSVICMFTQIEQKLAAQGATLEWVQIMPEAKAFYTYGDPDNGSVRPPDHVLRPTHSAFLVTTRDGRKWVADFTTEQFGFDRSEWFKDWPAFLRQNSLDGETYGLVTPDQSIDNFPLVQPPCEDFRVWMRRFYSELDWDEVMAIPFEDRAATVHSRAMAWFAPRANAAMEYWERNERAVEDSESETDSDSELPSPGPGDPTPVELESEERTGFLWLVSRLFPCCTARERAS